MTPDHAPGVPAPPITTAPSAIRIAGSVMELTVSSDPRALAENLRAIEGVRSADPTPEGVRVMASGADGVVAQVVEAALPAGLRNLSVTEPTLETVFIALTGRDFRE